jgi:Double zinc ribbon
VFVVAKMTPEQEASYALDYGSSRSSLSEAAQLVYDRLLQERQERARTRQATNGGQSTPEGESGGPTNCSGCGEELTPNARFCASCGEPVNTGAQDTQCGGCGEELTPNARFCASCGEPVDGSLRRRSSVRDGAGQSRTSGEKTLQEFTVKYVTFYDGSGHRLGPSECTLTNTRLIIHDARGGIHQILLRDISGISTPSRLAAPKMMRISLPGHAYDIDCNNKDQKYAIEAWLDQAIRGSLS